MDLAMDLTMDLAMDLTMDLTMDLGDIVLRGPTVTFRYFSRL